MTAAVPRNYTVVFKHGKRFTIRTAAEMPEFEPALDMKRALLNWLTSREPSDCGVVVYIDADEVAAVFASGP